IAPDTHLRRWFEGRALEAVHVLSLFRCKQSRRLSILGDFNGGGGDDTIELLVLRDPHVGEVVLMPERASDVHRFTGLECHLLLDLEPHTGEGDEIDQYPDMNDVPSVPAPVALDKPEEGNRRRFAVHPAAGPHAAIELLDDRACDESAKTEGHERVRI